MVGGKGRRCEGRCAVAQVRVRRMVNFSGEECHGYRRALWDKRAFQQRRRLGATCWVEKGSQLEVHTRPWSRLLLWSDIRERCSALQHFLQDRRDEDGVGIGVAAELCQCMAGLADRLLPSLRVR